MIDTTQKTLFISRKFLVSGGVRVNLLALTLTLEEDLDILINTCGNGRWRHIPSRQFTAWQSRDTEPWLIVPLLARRLSGLEHALRLDTAAALGVRLSAVVVDDLCAPIVGQTQARYTPPN